jgi:hypothetical protein
VKKIVTNRRLKMKGFFNAPDFIFNKLCKKLGSPPFDLRRFELTAALYRKKNGKTTISFMRRKKTI